MGENLKNNETLDTPEARYNAFIDAERTSVVERGKMLRSTPRKWIETIGLTLFSTLLVQGALRGEARADETAVQKQIIKLASDTGLEKPPIQQHEPSPFILIEQALVNSAQAQIQRGVNDADVDESVGRTKASKMSTPGFGGELEVVPGAQLRVSLAKEKTDGKEGVAAYSLFTFDI